MSRASSKAQSRDGSRPPSAIENNIDYFKEPVVKVGSALELLTNISQSQRRPLLVESAY